MEVEEERWADQEAGESAGEEQDEWSLEAISLSAKENIHRQTANTPKALAHCSKGEKHSPLKMDRGLELKSTTKKTIRPSINMAKSINNKSLSFSKS